MSVIYAFIISGLFCLLAELIFSNSKLTPGHITSMFSVFGAFLAFINVYDILIDKAKMGAIFLISNFGNSLYNAALSGFYENGFIGIFKNMLCESSLVLTGTVIFSFIFVCFFRSKD